MTSWQLTKRGKTDATDCGEVHAMNWVFKMKTYDGQQRKMLLWWTVLLMIILVMLLPAELIFETGIYERKDCKPVSRISSGICASPWQGYGNRFVSSNSLLTARAKWVDQEWETLLEGSQKSPSVNEVRKQSALKPGRRAVLTSCNVTAYPCSSQDQCGNFTIWNSRGPYNTVVSSSTLLPSEKRPYALGDVTFDGSMRMAFMFWEGRAKSEKGNRISLAVKGVEMVLSEAESLLINQEKSKPWSLSTTPSRTRLYDIHCQSDGLTEKDLTHAVSMYRTMQMEQPGVQRTDVSNNIARVLPMSSSDVLRSAYALKSEDWSKTCQGEIDVYLPCGAFYPMQLLPFGLVAVVVTIGWIAVAVFVPEGKHRVPHDVTSWRKLAHEQARLIKFFLESAAKENSDEKIIYSEYNGPQHVMRYSQKKYDCYAMEEDDVIKKEQSFSVDDSEGRIHEDVYVPEENA